HLVAGNRANLFPLLDAGALHDPLVRRLHHRHGQLIADVGAHRERAKCAASVRHGDWRSFWTLRSQYKSPEKKAWCEALGLWTVALACWDRRTPILGTPLSISPVHALC